MTISFQDICDLADLRDYLIRLSGSNRLGATYDDEIALLDRVIAALQTS